MSIPETYHFDNRGEVVRYPRLRGLFITAVIILVALLSFGIGRLTGSDRAGVSISLDESLLAGERGPIAQSEGSVTASSQGTRYYFSHCTNTISERNRVTFATAAMAEAAGYTLAKNCTPR